MKNEDIFMKISGERVSRIKPVVAIKSFRASDWETEKLIDVAPKMNASKTGRNSHMKLIRSIFLLILLVGENE